MSAAARPLEPPFLTTARLWLTPLFPGDADALFQILADPEVTRYLDVETLERQEQADDLLHLFAERRAAGVEMRWAIRLPERPALIGTASLNDLDRIENRAEFGLVVGRPWWRQGYASEAMFVVLAHAFDVLEVNRVESLIFAQNQASRTMVERAGFTQEGILRQHGFVHGEYWDDVIYSMLRSEWILAQAGRMTSRTS